MDELSQLIEPFVYKPNQIIAKLPDTIEVSPEIVIKMFFNESFRRDNGMHTNEITVSHILIFMYDNFLKDLKDVFSKKYEKITNLQHSDIHYTLRTAINDSYDFEIPVNMSYNATTGELMNPQPISITKNDDAIIDDDKILQMMLSSMVSNAQHGVKVSSFSRSSVHEVCDIFDILEEAKQITAMKKKYRFMLNSIKELIKNNSIRIRDFNLGASVGRWIHHACLGDTHAMRNLALLKVMSHENKAIYSISQK